MRSHCSLSSLTTPHHSLGGLRTAKFEERITSRYLSLFPAKAPRYPSVTTANLGAFSASAS